MSDIFKERKQYRPFEYDDITTPFINAMWSSHWSHNEFNFTSDVQDYLTELSNEEREVVKRATLLISQIEVAVKSFWGKIGDTLPKPEIADLGAVFGGVEVIHSRAYSKILEVLNLSEEFEKLFEEPVVVNRVEYLNKYNKKSYKNDKKSFLYSLVLFTLFTEATSLFSQFYILLGFNRFRGVMKDIANIVQYTSKEENCLIEGAEILTPKGWVDFRKLREGEEVYGFDKGRLIVENPTKLIKKHFKGNLLKIGNGRHSKVVTPNHDILTFRKHSGWKKESAKDVSFNTGNYIPVTVEYEGGVKEVLTQEEKLRIAIQADGCYVKIINSKGKKVLKGDHYGKNVFFYIKKENKKENLENILKSLNMEYNKSDNKDGYSKYSIRFDVGEDYKTFSWIDTEKITKKWAEEFIEEILKWDGSTKNNVKVYSSSNKWDIDIVEHIAILAGYRTGISKSNDSSRSEGYKDNYRIRFTNKDTKIVRSHSYNKTEVPYEGNVYCVTVPSGAIITRYNDEVFITGNCHMEGGVALINQIIKENPELMDEEFTNRIKEETQVALEAEKGLIGWMLQGYSNEFLSEDLLIKYVKYRMNMCMEKINMNKPFKIQQNDVDKFLWMEEEILAPALTDFFNKKPIDYSKASRSFSEDELF